MSPLRETVLDMLLKAEKQNGSHAILSDAVSAEVFEKNKDLDQKEKAFIKRLYEGTLEKRISLDYRINRYSNTPVRKMKPVMRNVLRMAAYELVFMDSSVGYAVCSESVELVKKRGLKGLSGFANAVLRKISDEKDKEILPERGEDPTKYFSVCYSVPEEVVKLLMNERGIEETEQILRAQNLIPPVPIRFRADMSSGEIGKAKDAITAAGVRLRQSSRCELVYLADSAGDLRILPGYDEGLFTVQDASGAYALLQAGIKKGDTVVDVCASPGGKSLLASELTGPEGTVISGDISEKKISRIKENALRMRAVNIKTSVHDASVTDPELMGKADVLILDVPCSGLGVMGKKRDIKYNTDTGRLEDLPVLQWEIAKACAGYVRRGGKLFYSTCTIRRTENEDMAERICRELGFEKVKGPEQLLPDEEGHDGFFYCVMTKS